MNVGHVAVVVVVVVAVQQKPTSDADNCRSPGLQASRTRTGPFSVPFLCGFTHKMLACAAVANRIRPTVSRSMASPPMFGEATLPQAPTSTLAAALSLDVALVVEAVCEEPNAAGAVRADAGFRRYIGRDG